MGNFIYSLHSEDNSRKGFYVDLNNLTSNFLKSSQVHPAMQIAKEFSKFVLSQKIEQVRSLNEYFIEILMFGIFWRKYSGYSSKLNNTVHSLSNGSYNIAKQSPALMQLIDTFRGKFFTTHLIKSNGNYELIPIYENMDRVVNWLDASKDFKKRSCV